MTRVAVIGNAAGGKSTMAFRLGKALGIPVYPLDKLQWQPGWVQSPKDKFDREHEELIGLDCWIIDGFASWDSIERRFDAADTIILVDLPLWVHYLWALKRQFMCIFRPRPNFVEECPMLPMTWQLLKMIWRIHRLSRPRLIEMVNARSENQKVFHIRSARQLRQFMESYCKS